MADYLHNYVTEYLTVSPTADIAAGWGNVRPNGGGISADVDVLNLITWATCFDPQIGYHQAITITNLKILVHKQLVCLRDSVLKLLGQFLCRNRNVNHGRSTFRLHQGRAAFRQQDVQQVINTQNIERFCNVKCYKLFVKRYCGSYIRIKIYQPDTASEWCHTDQPPVISIRTSF
jgi:hypothetical protein